MTAPGQVQMYFYFSHLKGGLAAVRIAGFLEGLDRRYGS
jgi:hypothetical protein